MFPDPLADPDPNREGSESRTPTDPIFVPSFRSPFPLGSQSAPDPGSHGLFRWSSVDPFQIAAPFGLRNSQFSSKLAENDNLACPYMLLPIYDSSRPGHPLGVLGRDAALRSGGSKTAEGPGSVSWGLAVLERS